MGEVDVGPTEQLYEGVPNQPLHGNECPEEIDLDSVEADFC